MGSQGFKTNISALLKFINATSVSKTDFVEGFKKVQQEGNFGSESIFNSDFSTSQIESIFDDFDSNGDGTIDSLDNLSQNIFTDKKFGKQDIKLLVNEFEDMLAEGLMDDTPQVSPSNPFSSGSSSRYSSGNDKLETPDAAKTYDTMSADELKGKLSDAQGSLSTNQNALNSIIDGSDSTLKGLQGNIDMAEKNYRTMLEKVAPELSEQYSTAKDNLNTHNQAVADKKVQVNQTKSTVDSLTGEVANLDSQLAAFDGAISELKAQEGSENAPDDLSTKISEAESQRQSVQEQRDAKQTELDEANNQLNTLNGELSELEGQTAEKEQAVNTVETEIDKLNNSELTALKGEVQTAKQAYDTKQAEMLKSAEKAISDSQSEIGKIQSALNTRQAEDIQKEHAVLSLKDADKIFKTMGLDKQGLNFDVFSMALEGYNNLEDKGNGMLGVFDTTQSADKERYYLLDMNNFELVGRTVLKTGSGNMDNIKTANRAGSHATLSGFERVGSQYYSDSMGKNAMRLIGLEDGINDQSEAKGTVVHYTTKNSTWGCKGFTPVVKNGRVDLAATDEKMHGLFPENTIVFTYPTDERYREYSELV